MAVFLLACAAFGAQAADSGEIDNVIIVLVDTLRADHLGAYGYSRDTSPTIDRLAREGALFERAIAPSSFTRESVAALFMGQYPSRNAWGSGWEATPPPGADTLASQFREKDYQTAFFSGTPMLEGLGFHEGFDTAQCFVTQYGISGADEKLVEGALRWMGRNTGERFFAYLHLLDPHGPYAPPAPIQRKFREPLESPIPLYEAVRQHVPELVSEGFGPGEERFDDLVARYDAEIYVVDQAIRRLLTGLRALGLDRRTLVVVTADHGEEFLEHGFVEHAWRLYKESVHIPMIFWAPTVIEPMRVCDPVSLVDIMPTLATVQKLPKPRGISGRHLFEAGRDGKWKYLPAQRPVYTELNIQSRNLVQAVHHRGWTWFEARRWLSPAELSETARDHKKILKELRSGARPILSPVGPSIYSEAYAWDSAAVPATIAPAQLNELKALLAEYLEGRVAPVPERTKREEMGRMSEEDTQALEALGYLDAKHDKDTSP